MAARGLGKGLDALIPNVTSDTKGKSAVKSIEEKKEPETIVKITKIEPNREQPRKNFDEDALQELADSIKQFGLLQPILVQDRKTYYEIIAGERRWRAAKLAGLKEVPVIIRDYTDQEIVEISFIENIQREDLNPIEEALAYKRLLTEFNLKQDEVAERVSKSRTAVTNSMRLLKLCDKVQQMIIDDMISSGGSMIDTAKQLKSMNAKRVFICCTFGLFTDGLKAFDEAYEKCYFDKIVTTNLTYQLPELKDRPYYVEADMSKFLASIIDFMNHDSSMANVSTPTEKIHELLAKYNNREELIL